MFLSHPDISCEPGTTGPRETLSFAPSFPTGTPVTEWETDYICAACQTLKRVWEQSAKTHIPTGVAYYYTLSDAGVSAPITYQPGPCEYRDVTRFYRVNATGEQLRQIASICPQTGQPVTEFWYNDAMGGQLIAKPDSSLISIILEGDGPSDNTDVGNPNTQFSNAFLTALA